MRLWAHFLLQVGGNAFDAKLAALFAEAPQRHDRVVLKNQEDILFVCPLPNAAFGLDTHHGFEVIRRDPGESFQIDGATREITEKNSFFAFGLDNDGLMGARMSGRDQGPNFFGDLRIAV